MNESHGPSVQRRGVLITLGAILLFALVLRALSFSGMVGTDDRRYAEVAWRMACGQFRVGEVDRAHPPAASVRMGLLVPTAISFKLAGLGERAMVAYVFGTSLGGVVLAFAVACVLFGARAGLIAALLTAVIPIDVEYASRLSADMPAAWWANLGVFSLYCGSRKTGAASKCVLGSLAGAAFGASWLCKESVVFLTPFVLLYLLWLVGRDRRNAWLLAATAMAALSVFLIESLVYHRYAGDFLFRLHQTQANIAAAAGKTWYFPGPEATGDYGRAVARRILKSGPAMILLGYRGAGFVTTTALLAVCYGLFRRLRSFVVPALWLLALELMYNFGSMNFAFYQPLPLVDHYLFPLILPSVALTAGLLSALLASDQQATDVRRERLFWGSALAAMLGAVCLSGIYVRVRTTPRSLVERHVAAMIPHDTVLYTDSRSSSVLRFFWGYPPEAGAVDFAGLAAQDIPPSTYVLINKERVDFLSSTYRYEPPTFYGRTPSDWDLVWSGRKARLYRTAATSGTPRRR